MRIEDNKEEHGEKIQTQRAKASARRQQKKEQARIAAEQEANAPEEAEVEKGKFTKFLESTPLKQSDEEKAERLNTKKRKSVARNAKRPRHRRTRSRASSSSAMCGLK